MEGKEEGISLSIKNIVGSRLRVELINGQAYG
jgi:hypothetical protein